VRKKLERDGGNIQHGWCIWELPGVFIEAEFHAIWISPTQQLLDVTPKKDGEKEILFFADPIATFEEATFNRRDNVRLPILDHPSVHDYIKCCEDHIAFRVKHTSPKNPQLFIVKAVEESEYIRRRAVLQSEVFKLIPEPYQICPCGSGAKFKWCCGANRD
jgi:hypothetical protein